MAKTQNTTAVVISTAIVLFIVSISDQTSLVTEKTQVSNEAVALEEIAVGSIAPNITYTLTYAPTGWKQEDCPISSYAIYNQSGTALTETTDYVMNATYGTFALKNTTATQGLVGSFNNSYVSYSYCGDNYMNTSWGRSVLQTNVGLYAIAILLAVVLLVYLLTGKEQD